MIDRICCICGEWVTEVWTVVLKHEKEVREYSGHFKCVTTLQDSINNVKNLDKKNIKQVLKELKMED